MFYFSEHHHFEDDSWTLSEGQSDYVERAKGFLTELFTCTIAPQKTFKGKPPISEWYRFTHHDGTTDCPAGVWVHGILVWLVPF